MNLAEFQAQYRQGIDENLNQLQTITLLLAELEARVSNVGRNLQNLSQTFEEYVEQQEAE